MVFKLSWSAKHAHVAWSGGASQTQTQRDHHGKLADNVLEIDGTFGAQLGLQSGDHVSVEYIENVPTCTAAEVIPAHFDDWEILEVNAGAVEERLLQQSRVIAVDQPIVFWLNASTAVTLHTTHNVVPKASVCLLDNYTEIMVAPKVRSHGDHKIVEPGADPTSLKPKIVCLRIAVDDVEFDCAYVNSNTAVGNAIRIGHVASPVTDDDAGQEGWVVKAVASDDVQPGVVLVSRAAARVNGFAVGELVRANSVTYNETTNVREITFVSDQPLVSTADVRSALRAAVGDRASLVLSIGACVPEATEDGIVTEKPLAHVVSFVSTLNDGASEEPLVVARADIEKIGIECTAAQFSLDVAPLSEVHIEESELAGISAFLTSTWALVDSTIMTVSSSGVLICGRRGAGKTSVLQRIMRTAAAQRDRLVYSKYVDCAQLAMEVQTHKVKERVQTIVADAALSSPALILLDDVDALLPAENEQADSKRVRQLASAFVDATAAAGGRVTVVATATGRTQIHASLFSAGVFHNVVEIPAPGRAEREAVLRVFAQRNATTQADLDDVNFSLISYLTEGYMPADLGTLYERAVHEATMRVLETDATAEVKVRHSDIVRAHAGFRPLAMRGVRLETSQTRWADIGGLADTRRQLRETLELPTKYAAIFATSPLRLRSGVLLYGFPGCGKTLLASAIARECGLNFIATKGPELLSKYIGSSEQSVRDLFKRAVLAAPCVLFFDEFDSIAPRRGHDNTGVTDRVVNQFLTEMDGAEGLSGVYVLAATSRPDLIDPALLRPGRLDKAFLCGMPDPRDREDILVKHATKVKVDDSVRWSEVAARTAGFTGADLQALVYNAFLEAVHEMTDKQKALEADSQNGDDDQSSKRADFHLVTHNKNDRPLSNVEKTQLAERLFKLLSRSDKNKKADSGASVDLDALTPVVTMRHFETAFTTTQSSLGEEDRKRFETIYNEFVDDKKGTGDKPRKPVEQKATLA